MKRIVPILLLSFILLPTALWAEDGSALQGVIAQRSHVQVFGEYQDRVLYGVVKDYGPEVMDLVGIGFEYKLYEESARYGTRLVSPDYVQKAAYDAQGNIYTIESFTLVYRDMKKNHKRVLQKGIVDFELDDAHGQMIIAHHIDAVTRTFELTDLEARPLAMDRNKRRGILVGEDYDNAAMPIFSPDGKRLFFMSNVDARRRWHSVDLSDGRTRLLKEKVGNQLLQMRPDTVLPTPARREQVRIAPDGYLEYQSKGQIIRIDMENQQIHRGGKS